MHGLSDEIGERDHANVADADIDKEKMSEAVVEDKESKHEADHERDNLLVHVRHRFLEPECDSDAQTDDEEHRP